MRTPPSERHLGSGYVAMEFVDEEETMSHVLPEWRGKYTDVDPFTKLTEGEPWFFLRAQDITAPGAIEAYGQALNNMSQVIREQVRLLQENDADEERYVLLLEQADMLHMQALDCYTAAEAMRLWQKRNPDLVKVPD